MGAVSRHPGAIWHAVSVPSAPSGRCPRTCECGRAVECVPRADASCWQLGVCRSGAPCRFNAHLFPRARHGEMVRQSPATAITTVCQALRSAGCIPLERGDAPSPRRILRETRCCRASWPSLRRVPCSDADGSCREQSRRPSSRGRAERPDGERRAAAAAAAMAKVGAGDCPRRCRPCTGQNISSLHRQH